MSDFERRVVIIPARPQAMQEELKRQKRVAAYCRVSTAEEEQQSSYEAQCSYYTDKIMTNPEWTMAGIFADEGISGTSTRKREEFNRMIRKCRQKKIDLILTKSISRFARNTVDCQKYVRVLKELGIGIYFEKENIIKEKTNTNGGRTMNIRKNIDYTDLYEALDGLMARQLPQMELYCGIGKAVCRRTEKGAAVMASEYLNRHYRDVKGFSPWSLRRIRDFYLTYEGRPSLLSRAMKLGWTLNVVIMEANLTMELREWYMKETEQFSWSKSELIAAIDANVHESMILHTKEEVYPLAENDSENDKSEDIKIVNRIADRWLLKFIKAIIGLWGYASSGGVPYIKIRNIAVMRC